MSMKVFISQPMKDKTDQEIEAERANAIEQVRAMHPGEDVEIIDSFFKDAPHDARPLWFLGKSLELLSTADAAVFCRGWPDYRGCFIERECCVNYGIPFIDL